MCDCPASIRNSAQTSAPQGHGVLNTNPEYTIDTYVDDAVAYIRGILSDEDTVENLINLAHERTQGAEGQAYNGSTYAKGGEAVNEMLAEELADALFYASRRIELERS